MRSILSLCVLLLALPFGAAAQGTTTPQTVSVLQFLIDTNGTGLFEPPQAYCVSDARIDGGADRELLGRLSSEAGRLVASGECDSDETEDLVVVRDGTPAILLWARPGTEAESRRSRPSIRGAEWSEEVVLVRAGLAGNQLAVEYHCWVRRPGEPDVLRCDARIVT